MSYLFFNESLNIKLENFKNYELQLNNGRKLKIKLKNIDKEKDDNKGESLFARFVAFMVEFTLKHKDEVIFLVGVISEAINAYIEKKKEEAKKAKDKIDSKLSKLKKYPPLIHISDILTKKTKQHRLVKEFTKIFDPDQSFIKINENNDKVIDVEVHLKMK